MGFDEFILVLAVIGSVEFSATVLKCVGFFEEILIAFQVESMVDVALFVVFFVVSINAIFVFAIVINFVEFGCPVGTFVVVIIADIVIVEIVIIAADNLNVVLLIVVVIVVFIAMVTGIMLGVVVEDRSIITMAFVEVSKTAGQLSPEALAATSSFIDAVLPIEEAVAAVTSLSTVVIGEVQVLEKVVFENVVELDSIKLIRVEIFGDGIA